MDFLFDVYCLYSHWITQESFFFKKKKRYFKLKYKLNRPVNIRTEH